jgi:cell division protein FtsQ
MGVAIKLPQFKLRRDSDERSRKPVGKKSGRQRREAKPEAGVGERRQRERRVRPSQAKGATRKVQAASARKPASFAWLNRILILVGLGVVMVAALEAWIYLSSRPVERISVTGELAHTRTSEVQDIVQPALNGGFLGADLGQVRAKLEALPWIYEASVRRVWPNALEINVVEQLPIARWGSDGFLNHEGEIFSPSDTQSWESLPLLTGPEGAASDLMGTYQRLVDMFTPLGLGVTQLTVDDRGQVEAVLPGGQLLMIGSDDFLERIQRFTRLYRLELAPHMEQVERIDLRYQSGVAVAFRELPQEDELQDQGEKA